MNMIEEYNIKINGIIIQQSNSIICNNYIQTGTAVSVLTNSDIVIQKNEYLNLQYIINSQNNTNISIDRNTHILQTFGLATSQYIKNNICGFNGKNNSLVNIFFNIVDKETLFCPTFSTGLGITANSYIWSSKFSNDGGCAFGYSWSDVGIYLAANGQINLNDYQISTVICQKYLYSIGKTLTFILNDNSIDTNNIEVLSFKNSKINITNNNDLYTILTLKNILQVNISCTNVLLNLNHIDLFQFDKFDNNNSIRNTSKINDTNIKISDNIKLTNNILLNFFRTKYLLEF